MQPIKKMRAYRHPIYGRAPTTKLSDCYTNMSATIEAVAGLLYNFQDTIDKFFPATIVVNTIIGKASAVMILPPKMYVRLLWKQRYEGMIFNSANIIHRLQMKGIYLENDLDYTDDPLFKDTIGLSLCG
jgi:hypothetical protein